MATTPSHPAQALQDALDGHDTNRREALAGVTTSDLATEKRLWSDVGEAIAALARLIASHCDASAFCHERPTLSALSSRLAESIDDQVDGTAWIVIDAAARAAIMR